VSTASLARACERSFLGEPARWARTGCATAGKGKHGKKGQCMSIRPQHQNQASPTRDMQTERPSPRREARDRKEVFPDSAAVWRACIGAPGRTLTVAPVPRRQPLHHLVLQHLSLETGTAQAHHRRPTGTPHGHRHNRGTPGTTQAHQQADPTPHAGHAHVGSVPLLHDLSAGEAFWNSSA